MSPAWNEKDARARKEYIEKWSIKVEDQDREMAEKVIEWAKTIPADTKNEYLYNLGVAARSGLAMEDTAALLISSIEAYRKEIEKVTYEKKEKKVSNWIGQIGDKITVEGVKQVFRLCTEGDWGTQTIIKFVQESTGNVIIWYASGNVDMASEELINIKATVKAHTEYKEVKQTKVIRVKKY
jgi:hypothetical protein